MHGKGFISIWFFIGSLLGIYGILIIGAGLNEWANPPATHVVLSNLHAAVWWGAIMLVMGAFYVIKFRPGKDSGNE
jgi:hypothetical protein